MGSQRKGRKRRDDGAIEMKNSLLRTDLTGKGKKQSRGIQGTETRQPERDLGAKRPSATRVSEIGKRSDDERRQAVNGGGRGRARYIGHGHD